MILTTIYLVLGLLAWLLEANSCRKVLWKLTGVDLFYNTGLEKARTRIIICLIPFIIGGVFTLIVVLGWWIVKDKGNNLCIRFIPPNRPHKVVLGQQDWDRIFEVKIQKS